MADIIEVVPGTYAVYDTVADTTSTVTIPVLTAGSIVNASASIGDTITVSGSNASPRATFQWQQSIDGTTSWVDIAGATAASLDTTTGVTDDYFVRRSVSDGLQGPVSTGALQVAAVVASGTVFTEDFTGYTLGDTITANYTVLSSIGTMPTVDPVGEWGLPDTTAGTQYLIKNDTILTADQYAEVTLALVGEQDFTETRIIYGYVDSDNYYYIPTKRATDARIRVVVGGVVTLLANTSFAGWAAGDVVRVERSGTTHTLKVNGAVVTTATDGSHAGTKAGFGLMVLSASNIGEKISRFECGDL